ncbi:MAG: type IV pilus biogenesis/stability protein PilW [Pseudomonadota bacterium]
MKFIDGAVWISVAWCFVLLAGCANKQNVSSASSGKADVVTESDEPENRRRARLRLELASGYFEQGQTNVALDELKQALVADPGFADAYNLRGLVYLRLNDIPLAEDSFRRALALNPRDAGTAHNYGWLLCQQARYPESFVLFTQAISNPTYGGQAKSLMTQGICQARAGLKPEAEQSLSRAYQVDAGNPVIGYNLANLLFERGEFTRAQFYIRRLNNSELANAETLWLGIKIEQRLQNREVMFQLADQLKKRYGQSREAAAYEKGAFNE